MEKYKQTRTCKKCNNTEERYLTLKEAMSKKEKLWSVPCQNCNGKHFSESCALPQVSRNSLEVWGKNRNLSFIEQDEYIVFDEEHLELMIEFLGKTDVVISKKYILLEAITKLLEDNILLKEKFPEDFIDSEYEKLMEGFL